MGKKLALILLSTLCIFLPLAVGSMYYLSRNESVAMSEPLRVNLSSVIEQWSCENGQAWPLQRDKMIAVCKDKYVDIRQVYNDKATQKGIQLTLQEWETLVSTVTSIKRFIE